MVYRGGWGKKNGEGGKERQVIFWETSSFTLGENEQYPDKQKENWKKKMNERKLRFTRRKVS